MTLTEPEAPPDAAPPQSRNHLLGRLPAGEWEALRPHLTSVRLAARQRVADPGQPIEAVYFPLDAVISLSTTDTAGGSVEVGSVGCEGIAGLPVLLGAD